MSTYEISKSSLLSLKAEILKKQQELSKVKAENEVKIRNIKKNTPLEIKNKGIEERIKNDMTEEEEDLLKKSRSILEQKSKLYDKLSKQTSKQTDSEAEYTKRYLVRFDKKKKVPDLPPEFDEADVDKYPESEEETEPYHEHSNPDPEEEWVEYVDCLGRSRTCLKKDLEYLKDKDKELKLTIKNKNKEEANNDEKDTKEETTTTQIEEEKETIDMTKENEMLSSDMRRELLRKKWEEEEEELRNKSNIHYQDILFGEARTHGVGYYGFSKDEEERHKQQEALRKLRKETEEQQKKSQNLKLMRQKQLAARIRAAENRKRARMGLPPLEESEDVVEPEPLKDQVEKEPEPEKTETEKLLEEARRKHVRPWDVGKEGVKEHYEYSQEEWVEKKRSEREKEFAPPSSYRKDFRSSLVYDKNVDDSNKSLKFTSKKSIPTTKNREKSSVNPYLNSDYECYSQEKLVKPTPILNELDYENTSRTQYNHNSSDEENTDDTSTRKGAAIPPPTTFDYYGPTSSKKVKYSKANNIEDSIEAGLQFLRNQVEKKKSSNQHPNEMYLL